MSIVTVYCPVSQQTIARVVDFEGAATNVICDAFVSANRTCGLKRHVDDGGPLSRLLERVAEHTLDQRRSCRCDFI